MNSDTETALITGSGQNLGLGITHHLAADDSNITLNGSSYHDAAEQVASEIHARGGAALVAL